MGSPLVMAYLPPMIWSFSDSTLNVASQGLPQDLEIVRFQPPGDKKVNQTHSCEIWELAHVLNLDRSGAGNLINLLLRLVVDFGVLQEL